MRCLQNIECSIGRMSEEHDVVFCVQWMCQWCHDSVLRGAYVCTMTGSVASLIQFHVGLVCSDWISDIIDSVSCYDCVYAVTGLVAALIQFHAERERECVYWLTFTLHLYVCSDWVSGIIACLQWLDQWHHWFSFMLCLCVYSDWVSGIMIQLHVVKTVPLHSLTRNIQVGWNFST
jgi:hypothetical protein